MSIPTPYLAQQPVDDFGFRFPTFLYNVTLSTSTDTALTVPSAAQRFKALIKIRGRSIVGADVWVSLNNTAVLPTVGTFLSTTCELINGELCREVKAGDVLHFITSTSSTDVSVVFYALGTNN